MGSDGHTIIPPAESQMALFGGLYVIMRVEDCMGRPDKACCSLMQRHWNIIDGQAIQLVRSEIILRNCSTGDPPFPLSVIVGKVGRRELVMEEIMEMLDVGMEVLIYPTGWQQPKEQASGLFLTFINKQIWLRSLSSSAASSSSHSSNTHWKRGAVILHRFAPAGGPGRSAAVPVLQLPFFLYELLANQWLPQCVARYATLARTLCPTSDKGGHRMEQEEDASRNHCTVLIFDEEEYSNQQ
jgi:hypothetical protein